MELVDTVQILFYILAPIAVCIFLFTSGYVLGYMKGTEPDAEYDVVHCRDCRWYRTKECLLKHGRSSGADEFCSYGERI